MLAKTESVALVGTEARLVEVEVHVGTGVPAFRIVGLPAKSVTEAEQRTRAALVSSQQRWPPHRITANLAPGALRKEGTHFDLALALGILAADGRLSQEPLRGWLIMGELGLDGSVRPVRGALAGAMSCRDLGRRGLLLPTANAPEATVIEGIEVVPLETLRQAIQFLRGSWTPSPIPAINFETPLYEADLVEAAGQPIAKRALEIGAAGGHNLLFIGPPGAGKTMLAQRLPGLLPEMSLEESMEVTRLYSVAGLLPERASLIRARPFRSPHQNISVAGLIGGGSGIAHPGEVSLAHHGVLFLDELSLFRRDALESLRAPAEDKMVRLARSGGAVTYPANFSLVAAMNPCPCGYREDPKRPCRCSALQLQLHWAKLSGPLMDRFDMQVLVKRLTRAQLLGNDEAESSATVRSRVEKARLIQAERYGSPTLTNASVSSRELKRLSELSKEGRDLLGRAVDKEGLTGRGVGRVLRVARTLADLAGGGPVSEEHVGVALGFRLRDNLCEESL
ncbi:MAG TPA: YifB family Mg chelatase-like AAA ATPase [Actinomycetota bacterium]|nr:YifB family Mg chelatase-like AAA ATPase [Actinomycetota bacterium]